MSYQRYRELYAESERLRIQSWDDMRSLQRELDAAIIAEYRRLFPKRKTPTIARAYEVLDKPIIDSIAEPFKQRNSQRSADYESKRKSIDTELDAIAITDTMPDTFPEMVQVDFVYSGAYRSQGFGAMKYAHSAADTKVEMGIRYSAHGIQAEKRLLGDEIDCGWGIRLQDIGIFANVNACGWDLIRRKPAIPVREWLKSCWKRGVNPRVYNPFLEHGLEERLGIDFFGNDIVSELK